MRRYHALMAALLAASVFAASLAACGGNDSPTAAPLAVAGIISAHRIALKIFGTGKMAALSQFPTLVVMLLYTTFGLWLLSAPFAGGGMAVVR